LKIKQKYKNFKILKVSLGGPEHNNNKFLYNANILCPKQHISRSTLSWIQFSIKKDTKHFQKQIKPIPFVPDPDVDIKKGTDPHPNPDPQPSNKHTLLQKNIQIYESIELLKKRSL
jgi:hypothetical protein